MMTTNQHAPRTALLIGAGGLVGGHCLDYLLNDNAYSHITILVRHSLHIQHPKLTEHVINFEKLSDYADLFKVNDVFSCLGIKGAASGYEFEQVEYGYPAAAAKLGSENNIDQFLVVTAMGSSPRSPSALFKYKGMLENTLRQTPLKGLHIFRPSLIVGERKIRRPDEEALYRLFKTITIVLRPLRKWLYIHGQIIAFSMVHIAKQDIAGINKYTPKEMITVYNRNTKHGGQTY